MKENAAGEAGNEKSKKRMMAVIICVLLIILIALAGTIVVLLLSNNKDNQDGTSQGSGAYTMDDGNYQQIRENMSEQVQEGYFETYMTTNWIFPDGNSEASDAMLGNSPNNTKPIRCELLLDETGEKLFETNVLPVGALVSSIKLNRDMEAGVYGATCMIYLMNEKEDGTFVDYSSAGFKVTLTIEK